METLERLASGTIPEEFPFNYASEFDAGSPWSLCIALFPETSALTTLEFGTSEHRIDLDSAVAEFVADECKRLGWSGPLPSGETVASLFVKTRLRQTDTACRRLDLPSSRALNADEAWINGIARTLQLWRRLNNHSTEPSLQEFESWEPEVAFDELISFEPQGWGLRQRLEFLVLPYLQGKQRVDLLQSWVCGAARLDDVKEAVFCPELASSLLQVCFASRLEDWKAVKQVVGNIRPQASGKHTELSWDTLFDPTPRSLEFIENLVEAATLGKLPAPKFQHLAEWSLGSADTQVDLLLRFLQTNHHFTQQELGLLRKTVFSKVDDTIIAEQTIRAALKNSRFMFLKTHAINDYPQIVEREVKALTTEFDSHASEISLNQVLGAIELLSPDNELRPAYEKLRAMESAFSIDPHYALAHEPLENVRRALEVDTTAYLRFTDLVNIVGGPENSAKVAEQCVEAALADDNFEAVLEFFDRGFVKEASQTSWIVFYQAGKYMSPAWDLPRPVNVLKRQAELLSKALLSCPERDLLSVLNAWSANEKELNEAVAQIIPESAPATSHSSVEAESQPNKANDDPIKVAEEARDHISNLLVSGIGWAIGANQRG